MTASRSTNRSKGRTNRKNVTGKGHREPSLTDEVIGISLSALAVVLFISVVWDTETVLPTLLRSLLRSSFGLGAYLIPVFILAYALTFFVRRVEIDELQTGLGLAGVFLALISMVTISVDATVFWEPSTVASHGGYLGGAVAWALRGLFGKAISYVLLGAAVLVGLVVSTGISISDTARSIADRFKPEDEIVERPRGRRARTVALEEPPEQPEPQPQEPARAREKPAPAKRKKTDPESRRKTLPTPTGGASPTATDGFELPPMDLLETGGGSGSRAAEKDLRRTADTIEQTLETFDVPAKVVRWISGPTVTMFEVKIAQGVKVGRVTALSDDLALALAAPTVRILAPIPGKSLVGIEVPNQDRLTVTLSDVLRAADLTDAGPLTLAIGMDVAGEAIVADLATMPHLLIAGATGTGKSVAINTMLMSMLMRATPAEVRLILIDPKRIELNLYNGLPHLYVPVVTEAKEAASALHWAVAEMDTRLKRLQKAGARNIAQYNALVQSGAAPGDMEEMSYLVIVVDELADLMMVAAKEVEDSICRLAQLARAAGIHLIVATQRPSTDIITGLIKTNITHRIAFAVSSSIDSRVILDQPGAENLVGRGDMLFSTPAWPKPRRLQGALVTEAEIQRVVDHVNSQAAPEYHEEILHLKVSATGGADIGEADDPLLWEAADIVVTAGMGSTSMLQRRLKIGYARAGRIMDMLEMKGIVGPPDGSKPREVLVDVGELEALKAFESRDDEGA
ncbi:MAG: DNA translocase FtsK [Coriobacteriia bacterium]